MKDTKNLLNAIIEEAMRQFFSKGYKNLNINELTADIGISKATFYKYIPSKELLFEECIRRYLENFKKEISRFIKQIIRSNKENFFHIFFEMIKKSNEFFETISKVVSTQVEKRFPQINLKLKDFTKKQIENAFFSIINKGREIGLIKKDIDDKILYFIIYITLTNLSHFIDTNEDTISIRVFFNEYFRILFDGILVDESKTIFLKKINEFSYEK